MRRSGRRLVILVLVSIATSVWFGPAVFARMRLRFWVWRLERGDAASREAAPHALLAPPGRREAYPRVVASCSRKRFAPAMTVLVTPDLEMSSANDQASYRGLVEE